MYDKLRKHRVDRLIESIGKQTLKPSAVYWKTYGSVCSLERGEKGGRRKEEQQPLRIRNSIITWLGKLPLLSTWSSVVYGLSSVLLTSMPGL